MVKVQKLSDLRYLENIDIRKYRYIETSICQFKFFDLCCYHLVFISCMPIILIIFIIIIIQFPSELRSTYHNLNYRSCRKTRPNLCKSVATIKIEISKYRYKKYRYLRSERF